MGSHSVWFEYWFQQVADFYFFAQTTFINQQTLFSNSFLNSMSECWFRMCIRWQLRLGMILMYGVKDVNLDKYWRNQSKLKQNFFCSKSYKHNYCFEAVCRFLHKTISIISFTIPYTTELYVSSFTHHMSPFIYSSFAC